LNLLVIISDTFRHDRLGCYRSEAVRACNITHRPEDVPWQDRLAWTPALDELASQSTRFDRYYAGAFPTMPARADLLTGKWTFSYRNWEPLGRDELTLPQLLQQSGLATAGVVDTPFYTMDGYGYDRGFQYFYDVGCQRQSRQLIRPARFSEEDYCSPTTFRLAEQALEYLRADGRPFLLWVDTWDPHEPWDPPAWYVQHYLPDYDGRVIDPPYDYIHKAGLTEADLEIARACYLGEISMVDRCVGRLLGRLSSLDIADETAVIFLSDHGFYFGEHGGILGKKLRGQTVTTGEHLSWARSPLYEEVIRVPLLVRVPGRPPGSVSGLVSAVDIFPTVLELADVELPEGVVIHGRSAARLAGGTEGWGRDFVVSSVPLVNPGEPTRVVDSALRHVEAFQPATITTTEWSLLYSARGEPVELYHLPDDPGQERNRAGERPEIVRVLHQRYAQLLNELDAPAKYVEPRASL
jgi:arylsulfatase A-like enzyme